MEQIIKNEQIEKEELIKQLREIIKDEYSEKPIPIEIHDLENAKYFAEIKNLKKLIREIKKFRFNLKYLPERINELSKEKYFIEIYTNSGLYSLKHVKDNFVISQFSNKDIKIFLYQLRGFNEGLKALRRSE